MLLNLAQWAFLIDPLMHKKIKYRSKMTALQVNIYKKKEKCLPSKTTSRWSHEPPECLLFQLRVAQRRLQQCLSRLGCSVMERERRSFLLYSQFYEQILQQQTQLLCQREQVRYNVITS